MSLAEPQTFKWTLDRYLDVAESGALSNERVELIDGEIIDMPAQKEPHALSVSKTIRALMELFPEPYYVKSQSTYRLSGWSAPEPDVMLLPEMRDQGRALHDLPLVVIEVAETTLRYDRVRKGSLYASRGIQDYWIVNIPDDQVEIYRSPVKDPQSSFGWKYDQMQPLKRGDRVEMLAAPGKVIEVSRMLP
jgi:Uma2 family endonuclease